MEDNKEEFLSVNNEVNIKPNDVSSGCSSEAVDQSTALETNIMNLNYEVDITETSVKSSNDEVDCLVNFDDIEPVKTSQQYTDKDVGCLISGIENSSEDEILGYKRINDELTNKITKLKKKLEVVKVEKLDELMNLKRTVLAMKQNKGQLAEDIAKYQIEMGTWLHYVCRNTQLSASALETLYQRDSQEKRELLSEMTSMNEELNRRSETISSLKEVVTMYEKKVIELNSQQDCNMSTIKQLRDELTDRTQRLHELSNQQETNSNTIAQLREELDNTSQRLQDLDSQQNVSNDTIKQLRDEIAESCQHLQASTAARRELEAEVTRLRDHSGEADRLSTSTVSRVEETSRLRDVEDSFEERYCKLKVVAVKLKKRATETQQLLDSERQKWSAERNEMVTKLNHLNASARNNQTLQQELDRLADELEVERKESKMLKKTAADAKVSEANLKATLEEMQMNIEALKNNLDCAVRERDSITQVLANKEVELQATTKEKIANELVSEEKTKEIAALQNRLKEEEEKISELQKSVESAKMEARKQGVLSLEMQNYEKSLADMSNQLSSERGRVASLEAEVQTLQDIRDSLQEQIRLLEERVATEEYRCQQAHDQLIETRANLRDAETRVGEMEAKVLELTDRLERERASAEAATLELATLSSAVQSNTDIMLKEKMSLSQQVANLSSQLATMTANLEQTEEELSAVKDEFEKYKVRATSVLRKHQTTAVSQAEEEAKRRADELQNLADTLRTKLNDSVSQIEQLQRELAVVSGEREAAETRCATLNQALADKSQQLERTVAEHRSQKLSLDTLVNCYKNQLEDKEKALQEQTSALMEELDAMKCRLREQSEPLVEAESFVATTASKAEPPLLQREDGEGSEYIPDYSPSSSPPRVSPKPLLPLDKLLETNDSLYGEREQLETELSVVKAELEHSRKRAQHQALLLADTEQDAARKEQLITVLKKEIGRLERCIQRQPHAQNTEYLKNVIFKFVTLEVGEDRLRLVPVMTTLLQLSPEETQRLTIVAKGESPDSAAGWGTYFSAWR